jgi:hypothetical protein
LGLWLAGGAAILGLSLLDWSEVVVSVIFRVWLLGGAAFAVNRVARFTPLQDDEKISSFAALVLVVTVLLVGLVIGGLILDVVGDG